MHVFTLRLCFKRQENEGQLPPTPAWGWASLRGLFWLTCAKMNAFQSSKMDVFQYSCLKPLSFTYVFRHVLKRWLPSPSQVGGCHPKLSVHNHCSSFYPHEDVTGDLSLRDAHPLCTILLQWQHNSLLLVTQASEGMMIKIPLQKTIWGCPCYPYFYT